MAKKNANGSGNIRKRSDQRWEARYCVGYEPVSGAPIRRSVYGKTKAEVAKKLREITAEIDKNEYFEPQKLTVGQWITVYESDFLNSQKYLTRKGYIAQLETHVRPALGAVKMSELTPVMINSFYNDLLKQGRAVIKRDEDGKVMKDAAGNKIMDHAPLSPKSVRNIHGVLTKCLKTAVKMKVIKENPALAVADNLPRVEKKEVRPLTDEEVKMFVAKLEGEEYKRLFQAILFMGLRESEASGLTWDCVDFANGVVTIKQQLIKRKKADGGYTLASTKSDKKRVITPAPFVMDVLKKRKAEQIEQRFAAGVAWEGFKDESEQRAALCFTTATGSHLCPQTIYAHYKKIAGEIGADDTTVHTLRHTFATISMQSGDHPKAVQENLGHYSVEFTMKTYGHYSPMMKKESADHMQKYIEAIG